MLAKIGAVNYRIQEAETSRPQVVHHNRMKPYFPRDPVQIPNWVTKITKKTTKGVEAEGDPDTNGNTKDVEMEVRPAPRRLAKKVTVRPKKLRKIRRKKPTNPDIDTMPTKYRSRTYLYCWGRVSSSYRRNGWHSGLELL